MADSFQQELSNIFWGSALASPAPALGSDLLAKLVNQPQRTFVFARSMPQLLLYAQLGVAMHVSPTPRAISTPAPTVEKPAPDEEERDFAPLALRDVSAQASALDGLSALASRLNPLALADGPRFLRSLIGSATASARDRAPATQAFAVASTPSASASVSRTATPPTRAAGTEPANMSGPGGAKSASATPPDQRGVASTPHGETQLPASVGLTECGLDPAEAEMLAAKLAALEGVLADELKELREQEIDVYVKKFEEAIALQAKLEMLDQQLRQEQDEIEAQKLMLALEKQEQLAHPELSEDTERPMLSEGDDAFTKAMKEHGLRHVSADASVRSLTFRDLPPPLDLAALPPLTHLEASCPHTPAPAAGSPSSDAEPAPAIESAPSAISSKASEPGEHAEGVAPVSSDQADALPGHEELAAQDSASPVLL